MTFNGPDEVRKWIRLCDDMVAAIPLLRWCLNEILLTEIFHEISEMFCYPFEVWENRVVIYAVTI